jgi:hypothetical protein
MLLVLLDRLSPDRTIYLLAIARPPRTSKSQQQISKGKANPWQRILRPVFTVLAVVYFHHQCGNLTKGIRFVSTLSRLSGN